MTLTAVAFTGIFNIHSEQTIPGIFLFLIFQILIIIRLNSVWFVFLKKTKPTNIIRGSGIAYVTIVGVEFYFFCENIPLEN